MIDAVAAAVAAHNDADADVLGVVGPRLGCAAAGVLHVAGFALRGACGDGVGGAGIVCARDSRVCVLGKRAALLRSLAVSCVCCVQLLEGVERREREAQ